jgi:hypothetical protein
MRPLEGARRIFRSTATSSDGPLHRSTAYQIGPLAAWARADVTVKSPPDPALEGWPHD